MKKIKMLTSFICALICAFSFVGCKGAGNSEHSDSGTSNSEESSNFEENIILDGYYMLADWENYEQCAQITLTSNFGKVVQSTEYVTSGQQSAKLEILGYANSNPALTVHTNEAYFQKRDFSDCSLFAFDLYSAMDYDTTMKFVMNPVSGVSVKVDLVIKPGWNNYEIKKTDLGLNWITEIKSFTFMFDKGENHKTTQIFYIDNFRAKKIIE